MKHTYVASNVPVLRFTEEPDEFDSVVPPEAIAIFSDEIPVVFEASEAVVGFARLLRKGDLLLADIVLYSDWANSHSARKIIKAFFPACAMRVDKSKGNRMLKFSVQYLILTIHGNVDPMINPLGSRLLLQPSKGKLN